MDVLSPAARSIQMSLVRSRDTGPEMAVRRLVHGMGYRYRLYGKDLPGSPDLVFKARNKVIFVHGCFWHLHRNCSRCRLPKSRLAYWKPKLEGNAERDKEVRRRLRLLGWRFVVLWECELANRKKLSAKIVKFLD